MHPLAYPLLLLGTAAAAQAVDPTLPPPNQHPVLTVRGIGAQVYRCEALGGPFQWVFQAPVARLFDANDREVGTHGDGPRWTYQDASSVRGKVLARTTPDPASIPALLLQATGPRGSGVLTTVEYIRRSDTHGGLAPAEGCDAAHRGDLARVPYTATYTFYSGR